MIIDVHGHYTTAPAALGAWRDLQIAGLKDPSKAPRASDLKISDDEIRETIETNQLKLMKQRGSDLTIFSPRASFMAHHIGDFQTSSTWAAICNELCYRSEEHTSELQSLTNLVCRLLLEKKKSYSISRSSSQLA